MSDIVFEKMKTIVSQEDGGTPRPRSMTVEQFQQVANMFAMELDILFRRFPLASLVVTVAHPIRDLQAGDGVGTQCFFCGPMSPELLEQIQSGESELFTQIIGLN